MMENWWRKGKIFLFVTLETFLFASVSYIALTVEMNSAQDIVILPKMSCAVLMLPIGREVKQQLSMESKLH